MGFLEGGFCYETYDQAVSAKLSGVVFEVHSAAGDRIHMFEFFNGAWNISEYSTVGGTWGLVYNAQLSTINFPACTPAATAFDPVLAGGLWMFGITMVLGVYLLSKNVGIILSMIRRF